MKDGLKAERGSSTLPRDAFDLPRTPKNCYINNRKRKKKAKGKYEEQ